MEGSGKQDLWNHCLSGCSQWARPGGTGRARDPSQNRSAPYDSRLLAGGLTAQFEGQFQAAISMRHLGSESVEDDLGE